MTINLLPWTREDVLLLKQEADCVTHLLSEPGHWTQKTYARNEEGNPELAVDFTVGTQFCLLGANMHCDPAMAEMSKRKHEDAGTSPMGSQFLLSEALEYGDGMQPALMLTYFMAWLLDLSAVSQLADGGELEEYIDWCVNVVGGDFNDGVEYATVKTFLLTIQGLLEMLLDESDLELALTHIKGYCQNLVPDNSYTPSWES